ncbi:MAG: hypothetical protein ABWZ99_03250, partial [Ilumatobacteraceae bacterium]
MSRDRWLEMDLTWFDPAAAFAPQLDELLGRITPLVEHVTGRRGIFFNLGWLVDLVTEWTGSPTQKIPTRSRRTAAWAAVDYDRLRTFVVEYRAAAARHGVGDLRCGVLFVDWAHVVWPPELKIYDFDSDWYDRHPELYEPPRSFINMPDLHPVNRLHADDHPYATHPAGIPEGTTFGELFGAQWAHLAAFTGLDAVLLRDGFCGPMIYTRNGPFGTRAPSDPAVLERFSDAVRALFRDVKQAAPDRLVFGYSSAISPVADWRVGCVDFESLVADGHIDGWIEQTWGGAWQDWWHQLWKGWTFQTANLLTRGAMVARANEQRETPCTLLHLVETWDGWEHWDTIHQVPGKLTWGAWAFAHAAALTPQGPRPSDGAYVSWMNNGEMELLSPDDVGFLAGLLDRTEASAAELEEVHGPTIVYDRRTMASLAADHPDDNIGEWIDDQAGLLMKWGVPVLSSTRPEWLDALPPDRALVTQPPGRPGLARFTDVTVVGRADTIGVEASARLGITATGERVAADFWVVADGVDGAPPADRPYLPEHVVVDVADDVMVHYASRRTPLITGRDGWSWWQPTDWSEPFNQFVPKYQLGSTFPAYRVAALLGARAVERGATGVRDVARPLPVAFHVWRSCGRVHVLVGNLETGEFGDARLPRTMRARFSRRELRVPT